MKVSFLRDYFMKEKQIIYLVLLDILGFLCVISLGNVIKCTL